jgi:hypothetical protein
LSGRSEILARADSSRFGASSEAFQSVLKCTQRCRNSAFFQIVQNVGQVSRIGITKADTLCLLAKL